MTIRNKIPLAGLLLFLFTAVIAHAAVIVQHPSDQKAVEGEAVHFTVEAAGQERTYQWLKDGIEIDGATSAQYVIDAVTMQDNESWYQCRVTADGITRISLEAQLVVYQKGDYDWDRDIDRNDVIILQYHIGEPHRTSHYTYDFGTRTRGRKGKHDKKVETLPDDLLEFDWNDDNRITGEDLQILRGYCTNAGCEVIEPRPPVILQQPAPLTMREGAFELLQVRAEGQYLHYQWQKNGADIPGAQYPWLWLESVSIDDDGSLYRCIITNADGMAVSREVLLTVYRRADFGIDARYLAKIRNNHYPPPFFARGSDLDFNQRMSRKYPHFGEGFCDPPGCDDSNPTSPEIVRQPHDLSVVAGRAAVFEVTVVGSNIGYQWLRDGQEIEGAISASLRIEETTLDDDGAIFQCRITSENETQLSQEVTLTVYRQGDFDWDGDIDEDDIRVERALLWQYVFWTNVEADFDGDRWITIKDLRHLMRLCTCPQCEKPQPAIISGEPEDLVVLEKEPATFTVEASGLRLTYQWQVDGVDIPDADESSYTLPAADLLDHGKLFRCLITNAAGSVVSREAELQVEMDVPPNEVEINGLQAVWQQDKAAVSWQPVEGMRYQIHRGRSADATQLIGETDGVSFLDAGAAYYFGWFYRVAAIKDYFHPVSNKAYHAVGPLSPAVELRAQPSPSVLFNDMQLQDDGSYWAYFIDGKIFSGSYRNMQDPVSVTVSGPSTFTAPAADGTFPLTFPTPGDWQVVVTETDGYRSADTTILLKSDTTAPSLVLHSGRHLTTSAATISLSGEAKDSESGLNSIVVTSDRYTNSFGSGFDDQGLFFVQVPVKTGDNVLTVSVTDHSGNTTTATVEVQATVPALPQLTITAPDNGATVSTATVDVAGTIRSSLPPEQIRLTFDGQVDFPTGQNGEYHFTFQHHRLQEGTNSMMVTAETVYGSVSDQVIVTYAEEQEPVAEQGPEVEIYSAQPDSFLSDDSFTINGVATSTGEITSVVVNGQPATLTGSGSEVSFAVTLDFGDSSQLAIELIITDSNGQTTTLTYTVYHDDGQPVIELTDRSLLAPPAVNSVLQTPWKLSGTVSDGNLAGFSINDRQVGLLPGDTGVYSFAVDLDLVSGEERLFTLKAWDMAGNVVTEEVALRLDSGVTIEVIAPSAGAELRTDEDTSQLEITVRVTGQAEDDLVKVLVDDQPVNTLSNINGNVHGTAGLQLTDGSHALTVEVRSQDGTLLARTVREFSVVDSRQLPLELLRQEPANNSTGSANNGFIAWYFSKSVDPNLLTVEVLETYHGLDYADNTPGADMTGLSKVEMVEVHRDLEPVPGGVSYFPEQTMAAFYPARNFAFGARIYVNLSYDGEQLAGTTFSVKPLPTFIQGFVADPFGDPIEGLSVRIPELDRQSVSDNEGSFSFGFGDTADNMLPPGRYRLYVNKGMSDPRFADTEFWATVTPGRLNELGVQTVPVINREEPFRFVGSGDAQVVLAAGELTLDLRAATLDFADGRGRGTLHAQFMTVDQQPYGFIPGGAPQWVFALHPAGTQVTGNVGVTIKMPSMAGSYAYLEHIGERVVLVGLDDRSLTIVPVGVGRVDTDSRMVVSEGVTGFTRLDIVGYSLVDSDKQQLLSDFSEGTLSLSELINSLQE
jgi:methionine-rich copper-binding protein CopC